LTPAALKRHALFAELNDEEREVVASLLDERAGFITGQVLYVCGGMTVGNAGAG